MKLFILLIAVGFLKTASAQDGYGSTSVYDRVVQFPKGKRLYKLPPLQVWDHQPWKDSVYRFPSFQEGRLEMDKGFTPSFRPMLNYNFFTGSIQILAPDGTKTHLKRSEEIKAVWIGTHKFIYDQTVGYLEIIVAGKASLALRTSLDGLYELSNGFKYSLNNSTDLTKSAAIRENRYYWVNEQFYLVSEKNKIMRATKSSLSKLLPKVKKQIKEYSSMNDINYMKKDDLIKITTYANEQAASLN